MTARAVAPRRKVCVGRICRLPAHTHEAMRRIAAMCIALILLPSESRDMIPFTAGDT